MVLLVDTLLCFHFYFVPLYVVRKLRSNCTYDVSYIKILGIIYFQLSIYLCIICKSQQVSLKLGEQSRRRNWWSLSSYVPTYRVKVCDLGIKAKVMKKL